MTKVQILAFLLCDLCKSLNSLSFNLFFNFSVGSDDLLVPYTLKQKSESIICLRLFENLLIYISHVKDEKQNHIFICLTDHWEN